MYMGEGRFREKEPLRPVPVCKALETPMPNGRFCPHLKALWDLWADRSIDGLKHRLVGYVRRKFPFASYHADEFAEDVVSAAFDSALSSVSRGSRIPNFRAWFYKTVRLIASKRIQDASFEREHEEDILRALHSGSARSWSLEEREKREADLLRLALDHARRLLPQVGTGQVRDVMDLFLEAIENDVVDYQPAAVADTLGITVPQARTLLHRGLGRLRRAAERDGVVLPPEFDMESRESFEDFLDPDNQGEEKEE